MRDGTLLGLGVIGALVLGVAVRRRGSRAPAALSDLQQQLLRLKNAWSHDPEVAIRAQDMVIATLPGPSLGPMSLPGISRHTADLLADIQGVTHDPAATLADYLVYQSTEIRENRHYSERKFNARVGWERFVPWIAKEIGRVVRAARAGQLPVQVRENRWGHPTTPPSQEQVLHKLLFSMHGQLGRVLDWAQATSPDIMKLTFRQAKARSDRWHNEGVGVPGARSRPTIAMAGEVVHRFPDGWTIQRLPSQAHVREEGVVMHHCVGKQPFYWNQVLAGAWTLESLRDPKGKSYLTLTVKPDGEILYAKGHWDRDPGSADPGANAPAVARRKLRETLTPEVLLAECHRVAAYAQARGSDLTAPDLLRCGRMLEAERQRQARALAVAPQEQAGGPNRRGSRQPGPEEEYGVGVVAVPSPLGKFPLPMLVLRRRGRWDEVLLTPPPELIFAPPRYEERNEEPAEVYRARVRTYLGFMEMASAALNDAGDDPPAVAGPWQAIEDQIHHRTGERGGTVLLGEVPAWISPQTVGAAVAGQRPQARRRSPKEREALAALIAAALNAVEGEDEAPEPEPQIPAGRGRVIPFRRPGGNASRVSGRKRPRG